MLEKIGLPERPSMRGNNWVVDASHCQGCSSQFTFINRKHHCRRCGGLFCGTCTQQRMVLRGQGDSPVRICDPCKKLEEAARFELRHGIKKKAGRGSSKLTSRDEDEVLDQILGSEKKDFVSSKSNASNSSASDLQEHDTETGPSSPEELRQQAVEEKNKYKTLRAKGKPEEALKAFKRGKELERQADALELSLRKNRRKAASLVNNAEIHNTDDVASSSGRKNELSLRNSKDKDDVSSGRKNELSLRNSKDKDDVSSELKELGWSDLDLHNAEKKPAPMSLEGELFSLLGEVSQKSGTGNASRGIDKTQVLALKKQALALKREGKLGEAKEKLKEAKILEKRLEEQEFLGEDEESDDELSALIRGMDNDGHDNMVANFQSGPGFNFDQLLNDDMDGNFEVTDEDMYDPDMDAALKSLGWDGETNDHFDDREALSSKVQSLKTEAIGQKLAGTNSVEAMDLLKKAKLPEKPFKEYEDKGKSVKSAPKSRLMIQKELLGIKKKALALRREGKSSEADEELRKGKVLEQQLEEMDNVPKVKEDKAMRVSRKHDESIPFSDIGDEVDADVTDNDMQDPAYLGLLKNLGWDEEDDKKAPVVKNDPYRAKAESSLPKRSKGEIQRELLGLKRKAFTLRRQGNNEEAEETQKMAKVLESQLEDMEVPKVKEDKAVRVSRKHDESIPLSDIGDEVDADVTDNDMQDPAYLGLLKNLGWDEEDDKKAPVVKSDPYHAKAENSLPKRSKGEIQRELLGLKRKALTLRRQGNNEEAEETQKMAKMLESQLEEMEVPKKEVKPEIQNHFEDDNSVKQENCVVADLLKSNDKIHHEKREEVVLDENPQVNRPEKIQSTLANNEQSALREQILNLKRNAFAFKKKGLMAEAKEELRKAKVLEKKIEENSVDQGASSSSSSPNIAPVVEIENNSSPSKISKPLSSRDRFKLQQESLGLKRLSRKLRMEGRNDEADAEFEKAKAIEAQLEELADKPSTSGTNPVDDVGVEDLLDPQLLSALRAIGIDDSSTKSQSPDKIEPPKKSTNSGNERAQLEEQIKAEKAKAVALKRSGKKTEALDALRQAKMYEKKLNSLSQ